MCYLPCPSCLLSSVSTRLFALHTCLHLHAALSVWQLFAELHLVQKSQVSAERVGVQLPQTELWLTSSQGRGWQCQHCWVWVSHSEMSENTAGFPMPQVNEGGRIKAAGVMLNLFTLNIFILCFKVVRSAQTSIRGIFISTDWYFAIDCFRISISALISRYTNVQWESRKSLTSLLSELPCSFSST